MKIVIIAPTFNEEENIGSLLTAIFKQEKELQGYDINVVVADSHSTDKTAEVVQDLSKNNQKIIYLDVQKRGLGLGLVKGLDYATSNLKPDILVTMEADLSNNPSQLKDFIKKLEIADLVVGSRYIYGGKIVNWSWWRRILSRLANFILMILAFTFRIHEFTNLYRVFRPAVWTKLRQQLTQHEGWLFVPAFVFEALVAKIRLVEQPIVYIDRYGGRSKMKTLSYTIELLKYALTFRMRRSASFGKFLIVGTLGFLINTVVLEVGVKSGMAPSISGPLGAEFAIISNFILNNFWTFSDRKLTSWNQVPFKFIQFNLLAFGSVAIQFMFQKVGEIVLGSGIYQPIISSPIIGLFTWYRGLYILGVGCGLVWNFIMYSKVVWKRKSENTA